MKIVGFAQLRNELELGNLENWFKCMDVCDEIYIYDQNSTDGSKEYYKKFDNVHVIESPTNNFSQELRCKSELLKKLLEEQPDTDWIYWIDGDTLIDNRLLVNDNLGIRSLLNQADQNNIESVWLGHYNLWRSDVWYRTDNAYHGFMDVGRMVFWKNTGKLSFPERDGLHQSQHPNGISNGVRCEFNLIHRGFASDKQLIHKYDLYKSRGQAGWELDRLLDEETLTVERVPQNEIPFWLQVDETSPHDKRKLIDVYQEQH
jgi:hypothetical protein